MSYSLFFLFDANLEVERVSKLRALSLSITAAAGICKKKKNIHMHLHCQPSSSLPAEPSREAQSMKRATRAASDLDSLAEPISRTLQSCPAAQVEYCPTIESLFSFNSFRSSAYGALLLRPLYISYGAICAAPLHGCVTSANN